MTILVLSPHPDDAELSCGASIHKWNQSGSEIHLATFSPCIISLPDGLSEDVLYQEQTKSCQILGIKSENIANYQFPVRRFTEHRQDILEKLVELNRRIKPDLVLVPNSNDIHQDHNVIYKEGLRAFKSTSIFGYELPWNNIHNEINIRHVVSQENMDAKLKAMKAYKSQSHRPYMDKSFIEGLASVRGVLIGTKFAEGFQQLHLRLR